MNDLCFKGLIQLDRKSGIYTFHVIFSFKAASKGSKSLEIRNVKIDSLGFRQKGRDREAMREVKRERLKRRQNGVLSGCLVSTQNSAMSTGGCGGFIRHHSHSPCT